MFLLIGRQKKHVFWLFAIALNIILVCQTKVSLAQEGVSARSVLLPAKAQIDVPLSLLDSEFAVVFLQGASFSSRAEIVNSEGIVLVTSAEPDLYQRQRLFLANDSCSACELRIYSLASSELEVTIDLQRFTYQGAKTRLRAEQLLENGKKSAAGEIEGSYLAALGYYESSLALWDELGESRELKNALYLSADAASGFAADETRVDLFYQLADLAKAEGDMQAAARALIGIGRDHYAKSQFEESQSYYLSALEIAADISSPYFQKLYEAMASHELGQLNTLIEDFDLAQQYLDQSLANFSELGELLSQAEVLNSLGFLSRYRGQLEHASTYHELAFHILQDFEFTGPKMRTLYYMGYTSRARGRFYHALQLLEAAESIAIDNQVVQWRAHIRSAIARTEMELGRFDRSESAYLQSMELYSEVGAKLDVIYIAQSLIRLYAEVGDFTQVQKYIEYSAELAESAPTLDQETQFNSAQVFALVEQEEFDQALLLQTKVLEQLEIAGDLLFVGRGLAQLAEIHLHLQDYDRAANLFTQAIEIHRKEFDDLYLVKSSYQSALSYHLRGEAADIALHNLDVAIQTIERIRTTLVNDALRQQFFSLQKSIFALRVQIQAAASGSNNFSALASAESFKSRTLYESIISPVDAEQLPLASRLLREKQMEDWLENSEQGIDYLLQSSFATFENAYDGQELGEIDEAIWTRRNLSEYQQGLKDKTGVLYFFLAEEISYLWLIEAKGISRFELPSASILETKVESLVDQIYQSPRANRSQAIWSDLFEAQRNLSHLLFEDLGQELDRFDQLIVVPDGAIHKIPFASLLHPQRLSPLVLSHSISYASSLAIDARLSNSSRLSEGSGMLVVANPQSLADSDRLTSLPYAEQEAEAIAKLWPEPESLVSLLGSDATKEAIYEQDIETFEVVHFATHALVDWDSPSETSISLFSANAELADIPDRGLSIQEISSWNMQAELVVLSACDTLQGKLMTGEGPLGLSRSFFEAGSKRVLATLWPVEDEATAFLMQQFYTAIFELGLAPPLALQYAQQETAQRPQWNHPYFWGGLVFMGNRDLWRV